MHRRELGNSLNLRGKWSRSRQQRATVDDLMRSDESAREADPMYNFTSWRKRASDKALTLIRT